MLNMQLKIVSGLIFKDQPYVAYWGGMYSSVPNCTYVSNKANAGPYGRKLLDHT